DIVDSIDSKVAEYLKPVFIKLKCLGISIILDDYGSYHECLEFATSSDVDGIKLDKYIITNSQKDNTLKNVVENLHRLGKKVIAEGVETEEQYETIRFYGCDEAQGYFWYKPLGLNDLCSLL
ncbi:MAG: EAL domain-containing protein, partial [Sarcina sp.]